MYLQGVLAVGLGGMFGALSRWLLGLALNPLFPVLPLGTLAANLIGGFLVGVAVGLFHLHTGLAPALKLLVITGFLGGLTTFSSFSADHDIIAIHTKRHGFRQNTTISEPITFCYRKGFLSSTSYSFL